MKSAVERVVVGVFERSSIRGRISFAMFSSSESMEMALRLILPSLLESRISNISFSF
jgi:hypothetical protein